MTPHSTRTLIACAFAAAFVASNGMADDCKLGRLASLDFTDKGAIVVPASLEGKTVPMKIDTGSSMSGIDPVFAKDLAIPEQRIMEGFIYDQAGEPFLYLAMPHDFGIGDLHSNHEALLLWPSPMSTDGHIGGIVAADILRHYDLDIDFGSHKMNLFSQDHCAGRVVYWTSENVAVVPVHIYEDGTATIPAALDGQAFDAVLDTDDSSSILSQKAAQDRFGLGPASRGMISAGEHAGPGGVPLYRYTFKTLALKDISIGNPNIDIYDSMAETRAALTPHLGSRFGDRSGQEFALSLGMNELRHLHLYIAYKEQKVYITPASAPVDVAASATPPAGKTPAAATTVLTASPPDAAAPH